MKKRLLGLVIVASLMLSACGGKEALVSDEVINETSASVEASLAGAKETVNEEAVVESGLQEENIEDEADKSFEKVLGDFDNSKDAYIAFLNYMIDNSVEVGWPHEFCESYAKTVADNQFAILDIDGDNEEELVIDWTNPTAMVGYTSYIFKYDVNTKEWTDELEGGGALTVFDNGVIYADASHNQGYGSMWPYSILKYNPSNDMFESFGGVDSEDLELVIDSTGDDSTYPYEYDPTGCGTVYYLGAEKMGLEYGLYTKEQFDEFTNDLVGGASIIEIDYKYINKESIEEISK